MTIFVTTFNTMKTFLLIVAIFTSSVAFTQTGLVTQFDEACNCNVVTNHYDEGQVSSVHHESVDGKYHGKETVYFPDGKVQYERTWVMGKLDGEGLHYHRNGNLHYKESYDNGRKTGAWTFYDENGTIVQGITYSGTNQADGTYDYYHAGVKYLSQTVENGHMTKETIVNQAVYDVAKEEAELNRKAGK